MNWLGLEETLDRLAKPNGARWYGHVLRRDNIDGSRAIDLGVIGRTGHWRPKVNWRGQVLNRLKR